MLVRAGKAEKPPGLQRRCKPLHGEMQLKKIWHSLHQGNPFWKTCHGAGIFSFFFLSCDARFNERHWNPPERSVQEAEKAIEKLQSSPVDAAPQRGTVAVSPK